MLRQRLLVPMMLCAGCIPQQLVKATTDFASATQTATSQIAGTAGIVTDLCRTEAQLDFLLHLAKDQTEFRKWVDYYSKAPISDARKGLAKGKASTWREWCDGLIKVDSAFAKITTAIAMYGGALGQAVQSDSLKGTDINDITKSAADDVANFSPWAKTYKTPLEGIGNPLQEIANGLVTLWVDQHVRSVVDGADTPLQNAIGKLVAFLGVVRSELAFYTQIYHDELLLQKSAEPLAVAIVDITVTCKLEEINKQLQSYSTALQQLAVVHAKLKGAWDHPTRAAQIADAKTISVMAIDVAKTVWAFKTSKGDN